MMPCASQTGATLGTTSPVAVSVTIRRPPRTGDGRRARTGLQLQRFRAGAEEVSELLRSVLSALR
jgi:hypothetical protein